MKHLHVIVKVRSAEFQRMIMLRNQIFSQRKREDEEGYKRSAQLPALERDKFGSRKLFYSPSFAMPQQS